MSNAFVLPKIEGDVITRNYGRFTIGPLESGYGVTVGNALRRVLLSSLTGAAVTSMRVSGVFHEFSDIPGAKEDMTTLMLNVKQLRLRSVAEGPVYLRVETVGKTVVTAGDLEVPSEVEIINPELPLLTLDSPDVELEIEFEVEKGRGYSPAEERGKLPIGQIPVDAIFSPVRKVNITVDRARVGQVTDYDRLSVDIWTDGTIRPAEALSQAARLLLKHFAPVAEYGEEEPEEQLAITTAAAGTPADEMPIEELNLSMRAYNCLKRAGITRVGEVLAKLAKGQNEILAIRNFGQKSLDELLERLRELGLWGEGVRAAEGEEEAEAVEAAPAADE
ncbi:MAG: DNA-directed RNA polymerase subunit alpha [Anaerolineae bacterium]|nr:DNA-directed RNA polymerase subunit alpha [Anaerolineae bacterium]